MTESSKGSDQRNSRLLNRWHARRAAFGGGSTQFVTDPEPRSIGSVERGRQLIDGSYLFAGALVEAPGQEIWSVKAPSPRFSETIQGCAWLDDLAALGDKDARVLAQGWIWRWISVYGGGGGPGWRPDLTGRRVIRWINHAAFLLHGRDDAEIGEFQSSLVNQTTFLSRRWQAAAPGLERFEALCGLIHGGIALEGQEKLAEPAISALSEACAEQIGEGGEIPSRNPLELLSIFSLLTWTGAALGDCGFEMTPAHREAIERIAPTLRTLRHSDSGLARFHGGGRGTEGWLDQALAQSGIRKRQEGDTAMGYARMSSGRTSVIIDGAAPPSGEASVNAHASTLAFELTSGRRPLIVNCGAGESYGTDWRRAGRATPSHSTLALDGYSSARLGDPDNVTGLEPLTHVPDDVPMEIKRAPVGVGFLGSHNGYVALHGLTHRRALELAFDGRGIGGDDRLLAVTETDQETFEASMRAVKHAGIRFDIRFHLHPDVQADLDQQADLVSLSLMSGERWIFRHDQNHTLSIEPSVYLEGGRLTPRATRQIVISGNVIDFSTRVRWSLSKAQDTAIGVRDLRRDDTALPN